MSTAEPNGLYAVVTAEMSRKRIPMTGAFTGLVAAVMIMMIALTVMAASRAPEDPLANIPIISSHN